ncbi:MAG TPA: hypothetical protein VEB86_07885 [Chryseosolibacter sp.]|nr:hypothetical protein [Chryseosolibacter sp.]
MSNNIFSTQRFLLLFKQHFIHNAQFLMLSVVAYVGVIFIVLSIGQVSNDMQPHQLENFQGFLIAFVTVFGILYVGYSFPAFRSKESTIHYLMLPASALEKFLFEFVSRIAMMLVMLPLLYWITFNVQGYFFTIFTEAGFDPIGIKYVVALDDDVTSDYVVLVYSMITGGVLFVLSLAFAGAAIFTRQPLVKSLFAVAVVVMFFVGYSYIVIEHLGLGKFNPPERMLLVPLEEDHALKTLMAAFFVGAAVMLFVAFRKLKEREV